MLYLSFDCFQQLTGQKATPDHAAELLNRRFCGTSGKETIVLLVDEVFPPFKIVIKFFRKRTLKLKGKR